VPDNHIPWTIRLVIPADHDAWALLYRGYRDFYELEHDDATVETAWTWVSQQLHSMRSLVAVDSAGALGALANVRTFADPSGATLDLFLDDLFTAPDLRGQGLGALMLDAVARLATEDGATVVRWITAADNARARSLYDAKAELTPWVTYDMKPA
jgi:GNAT superfamily N-acetyltransferase